MAVIRPELKAILDKYGINPNDKSQVWDCHGVLVLYHNAFEIIGAKENITFDMPMVMEANGLGKSVALCVAAHMGERTEWATGEATPANNKNAYPYAMAEKRAKDRAIAKLVGLAAYIYSEDEADDFKAAKDTPERKEPRGNPKPQVIERDPATDEKQRILAKEIRTVIDTSNDPREIVNIVTSPQMLELTRYSKSAANFLKDRANKRVGMLSQGAA